MYHGSQSVLIALGWVPCRASCSLTCEHDPHEENQQEKHVERVERAARVDGGHHKCQEAPHAGLVNRGRGDDQRTDGGVEKGVFSQDAGQHREGLPNSSPPPPHTQKKRRRKKSNRIKCPSFRDVRRGRGGGSGGGGMLWDLITLSRCGVLETSDYWGRDVRWHPEIWYNPCLLRFVKDRVERGCEERGRTYEEVTLLSRGASLSIFPCFFCRENRP